ncbi:MAG TPA: transcriptional regulator GcvA [Candidatus Binataceae bacterium]|nr:transcriptional regulator GcvA [Candidatus Binataceae bacterium]
MSKPRRLPPLTALRAFEAAGRHANFVRAAAELSITPAAVSQQVRYLEDYLGVRLFTRRARGVDLTAAGTDYARFLAIALDQLELATERARQADQAGRLTIATTPSFAARWLMPRLIGFLDLHPELDVRLSTSNVIADFARQDVDVAVRYGMGRWPGLKAQLLVTTELFPVCSPSFRQGSRALRVPLDLQPRTLLRLMNDDWPKWQAAAGLVGRRAEGPQYSDIGLLTQAAAAGQGVALGQSVIVADDLAAGRLIEPFKLRIPSDSAYYIVALPEVFVSPKVATFSRWLREELARATAN